MSCLLVLDFPFSIKNDKWDNALMAPQWNINWMTKVKKNRENIRNSNSCKRISKEFEGISRVVDVQLIEYQHFSISNKLRCEFYSKMIFISFAFPGKHCTIRRDIPSRKMDAEQSCCCRWRFCKIIGLIIGWFSVLLSILLIYELCAHPGYFGKKLHETIIPFLPGDILFSFQRKSFFDSINKIFLISDSIEFGIELQLDIRNR